MVKNKILSTIFFNRKNIKLHGRLVGNFNDLEIIAYVLVKERIYCLILEKSWFCSEKV